MKPPPHANVSESTAKAKANMSMKGFCYKQETKEYNDPSKGEYEYVNDVDVDGAGLSGFGMAIDLGGEYKINDSWTVNASVLDLGFMHWSNNMQAANRQAARQRTGRRAARQRHSIGSP